jgi:transcriptional regulator with XRE-family HTH domain
MSRLRELRKRKGLSQAKLADLVGASQPDIARLERGQRRLTADWIRRVAPALGVRPAEILEPDEPSADHLGEVVRTVAQRSRVGEVPVYAYAIAGDEACINLAKKADLGQVPSHPRQRGVPNAFAAYVACNSMIPRYRPGELVYVLPNEWPGTGEDCIIEMKGCLGFLKEFRARTPTEIVCWQHHPPREWRRPVEEVVAVHLVVGRG